MEEIIIDEVEMNETITMDVIRGLAELAKTSEEMEAVTMSGDLSEGILQTDTNILLLFIIALMIAQLFVLIRGVQNAN